MTTYTLTEEQYQSLTKVAEKSQKIFEDYLELVDKYNSLLASAKELQQAFNEQTNELAVLKVTLAIATRP